MTRYIARRLLLLVPVLIGISIVTFAILRLIPGDPARVMLGESLSEIGVTESVPRHYAVKECVFPFAKFPDVDTLLGPEMRSTGEVMGIDEDFHMAFVKAQIGASNVPPTEGTVFVSVRDRDKWAAVPIVKNLVALGFEIVATRGTAGYLAQNGLAVRSINKVKEGQPHIVDALINGEIAMVINTTVGSHAIRDSRSIRRQALNHSIPYFTTVAAAAATVNAMLRSQHTKHSVKPLQDYFG